MSTPNERPKVELPDISFMFNDAAQVARPRPTTTLANPPAANTDTGKATEMEDAAGEEPAGGQIGPPVQS